MMKKYAPAFILLWLYLPVIAQDGKIISKTRFALPDSVKTQLQTSQPALFSRLKDSVDFYRMTYLSDGLKVTGFIAEPRFGKKFPCIISNRGGNRDFGQWDPYLIAAHLGQMASWGYVVVASQYRGNDGGEGKEEFGGKELNDVLNLFPLLGALPKADTSRMGMEGGSRGGMMTYLALKKTCRLKAAVVRAGLTNAFRNIATRPEMEKFVFAQLIPEYTTNKEEALKQRSAIYWAGEMCKTTPLLIMHGSADWRVSPEDALELVSKLYETKHPTRFILYEGTDHALSEVASQRYSETRRHFDYYVRDGKKWPSMQPHGQ